MQEIPMNPPQVARLLGVAEVTVYKWVEANKIEHQKVMAGSRTRIFISKEAVALKKAELEAAATRVVGGHIPHNDEESMAWVRRFQDLFGKLPPLYGAFRQKKITGKQMIAETERRFRLLSGS